MSDIIEQDKNFAHFDESKHGFRINVTKLNSCIRIVFLNIYALNKLNVNSISRSLPTRVQSWGSLDFKNETKQIHSDNIF